MTWRDIPAIVGEAFCLLFFVAGFGALLWFVAAWASAGIAAYATSIAP